LEDTYPGGNGAKGGVQSTAADANEGLLLVLVTVILVSPAEVDLEDHIGTAEGFRSRHVAAIFAKICDVGDEEGSGGTVDGLFEGVQVAHMVILGPIGESKAGINAACQPVKHGTVNGMDWGGVGDSFLVVDHIRSDWFTAIFHVFPAFDFLDASVDLGGHFHVPVWTDGTEPGKRRRVVRMDALVQVALFLDVLGGFPYILFDGARLDSFA
jgi:hypothetical protein